MPLFPPEFHYTRTILRPLGLLVGGAVVAFSSGCSSVKNAAQNVGGQLAMRPAPTLSPAARQREKEANGMKSLDRALKSLDAKKVQAVIDRYSKPLETLTRPVPLPKISPRPFTGSPVQSLEASLHRGTQPAAPQVASAVAASLTTPPNGPAAPMQNRLQTVPARLLRAPSTFDNNLGRQDAQHELASFLAAWSIRQAALRADDEKLATRAINDKIAGATRADIEAITLAPVPPEVQLELTNLRLQLLQRLQVPPEQKLAARARIEEIRARLDAIWQEQTERQAALIHEAMIEVPNRIRREEMENLAKEIAAQAATDRANRLAVQDEFNHVLSLAGVSTSSSHILELLQPAILSPRKDEFFVQRIETRTALRASARSRTGLSGKTGIIGTPSNDASLATTGQKLARRDAQIWASALN